jgi:hypothetical protein
MTDYSNGPVCTRRDVDPRWWDLPDSDHPNDQSTAARDLCRDLCPQRAQCLTQALDEGACGVIRGGEAFSATGQVIQPSTCRTCGRTFFAPGNSTLCSDACRDVTTLRHPVPVDEWVKGCHAQYVRLTYHGLPIAGHIEAGELEYQRARYAARCARREAAKTQPRAAA